MCKVLFGSGQEVVEGLSYSMVSRTDIVRWGAEMSLGDVGGLDRVMSRHGDCR